MKKLYLAILLCLCIPLTACGGTAARTGFDALSAKMQDASALSFEAPTPKRTARAPSPLFPRT